MSSDRTDPVGAPPPARGDGDGGAPAGSGSAPPPVPAPRRRRLLRLALVAAVVAALLGVGLGWLAGTSDGLAWLLARAVALSGGRLAVDGAEGRLAGTVRIARVSWDAPDLRVEAHDVVAVGEPRAWLGGALVLRELSVAALRIAPRPTGEPSKPPGSFALPLPAEVRWLRVGRLALARPASGGTAEATAATGAAEGASPGEIVVERIDAGWSGGPLSHRVVLRSATLRQPRVRLEGRLDLAAAAPHAIEGRLAADVDALPVPALAPDPDAAVPVVSLHADVVPSGTLERLDLAIDAGGRDGPAAAVTLHATLRAEPFAARPGITGRVRLDGIDLAAWRDGAPHTALGALADLDLRAPAPALEAAGTVALANADPGALSDQRLPLARATAALRFDGSVLTVADLRADLGDAGRVQGDGRLRAGGSDWALRVEALDLRAVHAALRATALGGAVRARTGGQGGAPGNAAGTVQNLVLDLRDGPLAIEADATLASRVLSLARLRLAAPGGELAGSGRVAIDGARPFSFDARIDGFDPGAFVAVPDVLAPVLLAGRIEARGSAHADWRATVRMALEGSRLRGAPLFGRIAFDAAPARVSALDADLRLAGDRLRARGAWGRAGDAIELSAAVADLARHDARLAGRAQAAATLDGTPARPSARASLRVDGLAVLPSTPVRIGTLRADARIDAPTGLPPAGADLARRLAALTVSLRADARAIATARGRADQLEAAIDGRLDAHEARLAAALPDGTTARVALAGGWHDGRGGREGGRDAQAGGWRGDLSRLEVGGPWPARLDAPAPLAIGGDGAVEFGPARLRVLAGELALASLRWQAGRLDTEGRMRGLPVAPLLALAGWRPGPATDLVLRGDWAIRADGDTVRGAAAVEREAGDLALPSGPGQPGALPTGPLRLAALALAASFTDQGVSVAGQVQSGRFGRLAASLRAVPPAGAPPGTIPGADAALSGSVRAELESLRAVTPAVEPVAVVDGRASARLEVAGTLGAPALSGPVEARALSIDAPAQGIALHGGTLDAVLEGRRLRIDRLSIAGPGGGTLEASGTLSPDDPAAGLGWQARRLRLLDRPDRQLTLSGEGTLVLAGPQPRLAGRLRVDSGRIELPEDPGGAAQLGPDVVVVRGGRAARGAQAGSTVARLARGAGAGAGAAPGREAVVDTAEPTGPPIDIDLVIDAGGRLQVSGAGLETRLDGSVRVRSTPAAGAVPASYSAEGTIEALGGTYVVAGVTLAIDRARLIFDGPLDNPALDLRAVRRNQPVEVAVEIVGTAQAPVVGLTSEPPVADHDKLAWLLLGRSADTASPTDLAFLRSVAGTLLGSTPLLGGRTGSRSKPGGIGAPIARALRLDEVALRGSSTLGAGQVVALGKRLTDRLYVEFEQGLTAAAQLVRLNLQLTRAIAVRVESTGLTNSLGVAYRIAWD